MLLFSVREADFRDARLENTEARPWGTDEVVSSQQGLPDRSVHLNLDFLPYSQSNQNWNRKWYFWVNQKDIELGLGEPGSIKGPIPG